MLINSSNHVKDSQPLLSHFTSQVIVSLFVKDFGKKYNVGSFFTKFPDVESVDFSSKATAGQINSWCSEVTKNHINDIVSESDIERAVMLLINAIFFNGYWKKPFPQNETGSQAFFLDSKSPVNVPFMKQSENFYYLESDELNAKILRLPYKVS